jgi:hyperosmotically inducible protein
MKMRLSLLLSALLLAACAAPGPESGTPQQSPVSVDQSGRVVRARADRNQDDSIGRGIQAALRQSDAVAFKTVSVLTWDNVVLLTGAVAKPEHRRRAAQVARDWSGVRLVHDDLVMAEDSASTAYLPDPVREQRIYAGLLGQNDVTGAYVVRVVNGIATLLGTARSADDVARAMAFARDVEGIKWVVDHVDVR